MKTMMADFDNMRKPPVRKQLLLVPMSSVVLPRACTSSPEEVVVVVHRVAYDTLFGDVVAVVAVVVVHSMGKDPVMEDHHCHTSGGVEMAPVME